MGYCEDTCEHLTSRHNCKKYHKGLAYCGIDIGSVAASYHERCSECEKDHWIMEQEKELEEYRKAEKQGLLLRLPCKAGDRVYLTDVSDEIVEGLVTEISILPDGICVYIEEKIGSGCSQGHGVNDFGYNVFLKREDAEEAFEEELS